MFGAETLSLREFIMGEALPLATLQQAILEFLRSRDDAVVFGAQAVNAYVSEPRSTQDIDLLSSRAEPFAEELRAYLAERSHIAVRVRRLGAGPDYRPLRLPSRAVPRPWHEETPETLPSPILRHMSRPLYTAPCLAARRFCRQPPRAGGAAGAASGQRPPAEAGGRGDGVKRAFILPIRMSKSKQMGLVCENIHKNKYFIEITWCRVCTCTISSHEKFLILVSSIFHVGHVH
jgi:hypothetical protein